jgi:hypothetical protein
MKDPFKILLFLGNIQLFVGCYLLTEMLFDYLRGDYVNGAQTLLAALVGVGLGIRNISTGVQKP